MSQQHTPGPVPGSAAQRRKQNGMERRARRAAADAATEAELRAKYAHLPALPALSLGYAIAKATGAAP